MTTLFLLIYSLAVIAGLFFLARHLGQFLLRQDTMPTERRVLILVVSLAIATFTAFVFGLKINERKYQQPSPQLATLETTDTQAVTNPDVLDESFTEATAQISQQPSTASNNLVIAPSESPTATPRANPVTQNPLGPAPTNMSNTDWGRLLDYLKQDHEDLFYQRSQLEREIKRQQQFFQHIDQQAALSPHHHRFLVEITKSRWALQQKYLSTKKNIDNDLLTFWAHHESGSTIHTRLEFTKVAEVITNRIHAAISQRESTEQYDNRLIKDYQHHLLNILYKIKLKANKPFPDYSYENRQRVRQWAKQQDKKTILAELQGLDNNVVEIHNGTERVKNYQTRYPDIAQRLNHSRSLWQKAMRVTEYAYYRIYHLLEAEQLLGEPKLELSASAAARLDQELEDEIANITRSSRLALQNAKNSYQAEITMQ